MKTVRNKKGLSDTAADQSSEASWSSAPDSDAVLLEAEWALARWFESYVRLTRETLGSVGGPSISAPEVMILNVIRMNDHPKTISLIGNLLNRTDTQNLQYSIRKLISLDLVTKVSQKGVPKAAAGLTTTTAGKQLCDELARLRREILLDSLSKLHELNEKLGTANRTISLMTALYDQAERSLLRMTVPL